MTSLRGYDVRNGIALGFSLQFPLPWTESPPSKALVCQHCSCFVPNPLRWSGFTLKNTAPWESLFVNWFESQCNQWNPVDLQFSSSSVMCGKWSLWWKRIYDWVHSDPFSEWAARDDHAYWRGRSNQYSFLCLNTTLVQISPLKSAHLQQVLLWWRYPFRSAIRWTLDRWSATSRVLVDGIDKSIKRGSC